MTTRTISFLCLSTCIALLLAAHAVQAEPTWIQSRVHNAHQPADSIVPKELTDENYRWTLDMPGLGHASPVYYDGKIYTTSEVDGKHKRQVICVDADNGKILWTYEEEYKETVGHHAFNSYASSTPVVDERGVYVSWISAGDFIIFSLDHDGKPRWRQEIPCAFSSTFGAGASPVLVGDMVVMTNEHAGGKCFLIGIDAQSGEIAWQTPRDTGLVSYCTPFIYQPPKGDVQLLSASTAHGVYSFSPKTGKILWEVPCDFVYKTCASPVVADGVIFVTAGRGSAGKETAAIRLPDLTKNEKPKLLYQSKARLPYVPTPMPIGDNFILWNDAGVVSCIKARTGESLWEGRVGGTFFSSPVLIDGKLYAIDRKGNWIGIATDRFEVLHELKLPEGAHSTPLVIGNKIFIRTYHKLLCIEN